MREGERERDRERERVREERRGRVCKVFMYTGILH